MPNRWGLLRSVQGTISAAWCGLFCFDGSIAAASMAVILFASIAVAQTQGQDSSKPAEQSGQEKPKSSGAAAIAKPAEAVNLLDEKSIIFPDIAASTQPLSPGKKFELFVDNSISVHTILYSAVSSAVSQADNSPTGFGQGWDAYGKRFGSLMAREASGQFFGTFILASALHTDPRFFPDKDPTFGHAVGVSLKRIFVTKSDSGKQVMDVAGLMGPLLGEGLANAYWPDRNRTVGDTFMRYGLDLATNAGGNLLREYWPVFVKKVSHSASSRNASSRCQRGGSMTAAGKESG